MVDSMVRSKLKRACREIVFDEVMKKHSSVKIGGEVFAFAQPESVSELVGLIAVCDRFHVRAKIVGNCSNLLFSDECMEICVISLVKFRGIVVDPKLMVMTVGAGVTIGECFAVCAKLGASGFERIAGIPGTIGASIVGNAGAFGTEISDNLLSVQVLRNKAVIQVNKEEMQFGYRFSSFKQSDDIILSARFELKESSTSSVLSIMKECMAKRKMTQPFEPSLGSVFKKHGEISAGLLIDQAGMKGMRVGGCEISNVHANFIVNNGDGTAKDFKALADLAQNIVKTKFDIDLLMEIEYI